MPRKFISRTFINDISRVIVCNICFGFLKDPVECQKCQNVWCRRCICQNQNKCPCKCEDTLFVKPHRFFRQFISEIVIECERCSQRMSFSQYEEHLALNICNLEQDKKEVNNNQLPSNSPPKLNREKPAVLPSKPRKIQRTVDLSDNEAETLMIQTVHQPADDQSSSDTSRTSPILRKSKKEPERKVEEKITIAPVRPSFNVKMEESGYSEHPSWSRHPQQMNKQSSNITGPFSKVSIHYHEGEKYGWKSVEQSLNNEVISSLTRQAEREGHIENAKIQIRNTVFDFSRFEQYEAYSTLMVEGDELNHLSKQMVSKRIKFLPFKTLKDLYKHVQVYVSIESDKIFYDRSDTKKILKAFFNNTQTKIQTQRSQIYLNELREFNGSKMRDIKFMLKYLKEDEDDEDEEQDVDEIGDDESESI